VSTRVALHAIVSHDARESPKPARGEDSRAPGGGGG
jgi:hypothetical protein